MLDQGYNNFEYVSVAGFYVVKELMGVMRNRTRARALHTAWPDPCVYRGSGP